MDRRPFSMEAYVNDEDRRAFESSPLELLRFLNDQPTTGPRATRVTQIISAPYEHRPPARKAQTRREERPAGTVLKDSERSRVYRERKRAELDVAKAELETARETIAALEEELEETRTQLHEARGALAQTHFEKSQLELHLAQLSSRAHPLPSTSAAHVPARMIPAPRHISAHSNGEYEQTGGRDLSTPMETDNPPQVTGSSLLRGRAHLPTSLATVAPIVTTATAAAHPRGPSSSPLSPLSTAIPLNTDRSAAVVTSPSEPSTPRVTDEAHITAYSKLKAVADRRDATDEELQEAYAAYVKIGMRRNYIPFDALEEIGRPEFIARNFHFNPADDEFEETDDDRSREWDAWQLIVRAANISDQQGRDLFIVRNETFAVYSVLMKKRAAIMRDLRKFCRTKVSYVRYLTAHNRQSSPEDVAYGCGLIRKLQTNVAEMLVARGDMMGRFGRIMSPRQNVTLNLIFRSQTVCTAEAIGALMNLPTIGPGEDEETGGDEAV